MKGCRLAMLAVLASGPYSVISAVLLEDRTAENVAAAWTSVPPAVAIEGIVDQSAMARDPTCRVGSGLLEAGSSGRGTPHVSFRRW